LSNLQIDDADNANALFEKVLKEMGVETLTKRDAVEKLSHYLAQQILGGAVSPYTGAKEIWKLTLAAQEECFPELDPFIYAASEYEDRISDRPFFDNAIMREAESFVRKQKLAN
jgi:hypothetical protein